VAGSPNLRATPGHGKHKAPRARHVQEFISSPTTCVMGRDCRRRRVRGSPVDSRTGTLCSGAAAVPFNYLLARLSRKGVGQRTGPWPGRQDAVNNNIESRA
jgi:hypothetical protein